MTKKEAKLFVFAAPSGSGKTTIVKDVLKNYSTALGYEVFKIYQNKVFMYNYIISSNNYHLKIKIVN